jgi:hypothetical protein
VAQLCWPEIDDEGVAFHRRQDVNMNLGGPFQVKGSFRLFPGERPAKENDVRRFALHWRELLGTA